MTRGRARLVGVVGSAGALLLGIVVGGLLSPVQAQRDAPTPTAAPAGEGYVGAETCKLCHEDAYNRFATTKMGRLFLKHPRNTVERLACETCHGRGKAHVDGGGGRAPNARLVTF